jgi:hypothetical protein
LRSISNNYSIENTAFKLNALAKLNKSNEFVVSNILDIVAIANHLLNLIIF